MDTVFLQEAVALNYNGLNYIYLKINELII